MVHLPVVRQMMPTRAVDGAVPQGVDGCGYRPPVGCRAPWRPARHAPVEAVQAVGPKGSLAPLPRYLRLTPTASGRCFLLDPLGLPPPLTASPPRPAPAVCPLAEYLILKMQSYYHFEKNAPAPKAAK